MGRADGQVLLGLKGGTDALLDEVGRHVDGWRGMLAAPVQESVDAPFLFIVDQSFCPFWEIVPGP
jgi:hypothetical protein